MGCGISTPVPPRSPTPPLRSPTPPPRSPTPPPRSPTPPPRSPTPPPPPPRETTVDFSSDCIDIQIDQRQDENEIERKESGYPGPTPPDQVDGIIKPKERWFDDDDFNNASDDADLLKIDSAEDDEDISEDLMSDSAKFVSSPTRKAKPTVLFDEVDDHAKSAGSSLLDSFDAVVRYLRRPFENDKYKKMKIARAIVAWMSNQQIDNAQYGNATLHTPRGLLQYLKEGRMTYTTCYTILCREAGLQCVTIKGHVKAAGYEPGSKDVPEVLWNAVHVECGWQLVHPFWVCRALYGHNLGGWVKVEADGTTMAKRERASDGVVRNTFQERYFMPDPEEFIYECSASDTQWQLVKPSFTVPSKDHFLERPYLLPPFFGVGFELMGEQKCVLHSKAGFCKIELRAKPANAHMIMLKYELFMKDTNNDTINGPWNKEDMSRMVFNSRAGEVFVFDIRFPKTGTYKLVIYGGPYTAKTSSVLRLCEFKLVCENEMVGRHLLPLDCSNIGWGPGPVATEGGLLMPSKPNGLIPVNKSEKKAEMKFQLRDEKREYSAHLHGEVGGRRQIFDEHIRVTQTKLQLVIFATIPSEGEFGVSIHQIAVTSVGAKCESATICNYLLSTFAYKMVKADVRNAKKKLEDSILEEVVESQWKNKISSIDDCIDRCLRTKVPETDDDITAAKTYRELLWVKDKLRDCKLRRHLGVTRRTLDIVSRYRNKDALHRDIESVRKLERELAELVGDISNK